MSLWSLWSGIGRGAHFQDARRYPSDHRIVGNILNDHGIRTDDDVVTHTHAPQDLGASTELDTVADGRRAQWILRTGVAEGHAVTDQTVIADYGPPVNDDAAMMLDAQAPSDGCVAANTDSAKDLGELIEYDVRN